MINEKGTKLSEDFRGILFFRVNRLVNIFENLDNFVSIVCKIFDDKDVAAQFLV
jgi:hypothetical protein